MQIDSYNVIIFLFKFILTLLQCYVSLANQVFPDELEQHIFGNVKYEQIEMKNPHFLCKRLYVTLNLSFYIQIDFV